MPPPTQKPTTATTTTVKVTHPYRTLITVFLAWKLFLFSIALGATLIGDAYDTSAGLVVQGVGAGSSDVGPLAGLVARLTSWDAIYYVSAARRGYLFEQEWAFGGMLPVFIRRGITVLEYFGILGPAPAGGALREAVAGILVANAAHLLSAIVLFRLGQVLWRKDALSMVAAILHVLSPAGLFLSAPYAESSCAFYSFYGYLIFALSCRMDHRPAYRDAYVILAGTLFGIATAFRSNGILNGIPFAWEVVRLLPRLPQRPVDTVRRLVALGIGGVCVAAGSIIPQFMAYMRYCSGTSEPRPWCQDHLPSIYTFVQQHYWNVGFLRYWTLSNLPLFLLATPMLIVLVKSGMECLVNLRRPTPEKPMELDRLASLLQSAAAAQVLLAALALTTYHVQIITRISSGYPLWHWWLAERVMSRDKSGKWLVKFMVIYAAVQGALFASFLPPA